MNNKEEMTIGYAFPIGLILIILIMIFTVCVVMYILVAKRDKGNNKLYLKNILINIGLLVFSGIVYMIYEKITNEMYSGRWPSVFHGIITLFYILFLNVSGIVFSIIKFQKMYLALLAYILFIISTILTYNLIVFFGNTEILSESSSILPIGVFILSENILSWLIVKIIIKIKNGVRHNFA